MQIKQESFRRIYNKHISESSSPKHNQIKRLYNGLSNCPAFFKSYDNRGTKKKKPSIGSKDGFRNISPATKNTNVPLLCLYQKAQNEVLTNKPSREGYRQEFRLPLHQRLSSKQIIDSNATSAMPSSRRDNTPKNWAPKATPRGFDADGCSTPEQRLEKYAAMNISPNHDRKLKKNSMKPLNLKPQVEQAQALEKGIFISVDITQKNQSKKVQIKLNLDNRNHIQRYQFG